MWSIHYFGIIVAKTGITWQCLVEFPKQSLFDILFADNRSVCKDRVQIRGSFNPHQN
jgi:hypothetical protein